MPKRLIALALVAGALTGCSPAQTRAWLRWWREEPRAAVAWARHECAELCTLDWDHDGVVEPEPEAAANVAETYVSEGDDGSEVIPADVTPDEPDNGSAGGTCGEWYGTAISAGWSDADWPTVDRIMYAESRCQAGAYNGASGVTGLMQIMPFWAEDCGGSPSDLYDPWFNLHCALHVKAVQGWSAWVTY